MSTERFRENYIICPYCGHVHEDMCDYPWGPIEGEWKNGEMKDFDCGGCDKEFSVELCVDYAFSSYQKEEAKEMATEINLCGHTIRLGDFVKVRYASGTWSKDSILSGKIIELWSMALNNHLQARVENGWCFHDHDEILSHKPCEVKEAKDEG